MRPRLASLSDFRFGAVPTETIEDALLHLAQQNEQAVQEAAGRMGSFRATRIVGVDAGPGKPGLGETRVSVFEAPALRFSLLYSYK